MIKLIKEYLKPYLKYAIIGPLAVAVAVICELLLPRISADMINIGINENDSSFLVKMSIFLIILVIIEMLSVVVSSVASSIAGQRFGADIRDSLFVKIQSFSAQDRRKFHTSSLITRLTNDINQIQNTMQMMLRIMIRAPIMCIGGIFMAYNTNPKLTVIILFAIPLIFIIIFVIMKKGIVLFKLAQEKVDAINNVALENLAGVRVVKAFVKQESEKEKYDIASIELKETNYEAIKLILSIMPIMMLIMNFSLVAVLWFGGNSIVSGNMKVGDLHAFINYITMILFSFLFLAMIFVMLSRSKASSDRIIEVLESETSILDDGNKDFPISEGRIEFKNITYGTTGKIQKPLFDNISFAINGGETIGIVGETGSGKSTIINLLLRLYEANEGEILIDGININKYSFKSLRENIAYVLQENTILTGTVKENILLKTDVAKEENMLESAKISQADEFVSKYDDKYEHFLERGGVNLSGGQKQRVCIARALVKKAKIVIFDDSTSALDSKTERKVMNGLNDFLPDATKLIISQKISSIRNADKIIVLSNGKILGFDSHEKLLETCSVYKEINASQTKGGVIGE